MSCENASMLRPGQLVTSRAGRDQGQTFVVLALEDEGHFAQVADGRVRAVVRPKRKNVRHLQAHAAIDAGVAACVARGGVPTDAEVREALAAYARSNEPGADSGDGEEGL